MTNSPPYGMGISDAVIILRGEPIKGSLSYSYLKNCLVISREMPLEEAIAKAYEFPGKDTRPAPEPFPVAQAFIKWMEACWPNIGPGTTFNLGVQRGFEIIKAQIEAGHTPLTRPASTEPADALAEARDVLTQAHSYLDVAAGAGHICQGIDAADLFHKVDAALSRLNAQGEVN